MANLVSVRAAQPLNGALVVELDDPAKETPDVISALVLAGARITGVNEQSATLEDVYLELVGEAGVRDEHDLADAEAAA
jgi:hypothetical protein